MGKTSTTPSPIREDVLRDPRYPVHRIADRRLPYLETLVNRFHPQQIILFGSYTYGEPDPGSDVDLLIVKENRESPLAEMRKIRQEWRPIHHRQGHLSIQLLVESPIRHRKRLENAAGFYDDINARGIRLV